MKILIIFFVSLLSCSVMAEPRFDADSGNVHWVLSADNADREIEEKREVRVTRLDNGNLAASIKAQFIIATDELPEIPEYGGMQRIEICGNCNPDPSIGQLESAASCVVVDDGGNVHTTTVWWTSLKVINDEWGWTTLDATLKCLNATAN